MKILYVAPDRRSAELATAALRSAKSDISVAWSADVSDARRWIDKNRDVVTLIVEVESDVASCESFVRQIRALGITAPVIVASATGTASALQPVVDEITVKDFAFFDNLPGLVARALQRTRSTARPARRPLRFLYLGDAALARECLARQGSIEVVESLPQPGAKLDALPANLRPGEPLPFDVLFLDPATPGVEANAILKDIGARKFQVPIVIVGEWDEELAMLSLKLGAVEYVPKSSASFRALLFKISRLLSYSTLLRERPRLVENLAKAEAAREHVEQLRARDATSFAERLAQQEADFAANLSHATSDRRALDDKITMIEVALHEADQRYDPEPQSTAIAPITQAQTAFDERLAQVVGERDRLEERLNEVRSGQERLEQRVADADRSLRYAERRAAEQFAAREQALERQAQIEAELSRERSNADTIVRQLDDARLALLRAQQESTTDAAAAEARLAEFQQQADARLTQAVAAADAIEVKREALAKQLAEAEAARLNATHEHASELAAAAARLAEYQQQAAAQLAKTVAAADALEAEGEALIKQLADAEAARQKANRDHAIELAAAVERLAEYQDGADSRLAQTVAAIDADRRRAEELHATESAAAAARLAEYQRDAEARLAHATAAADTLETKREALVKQLADTEAARQKAQHQHASDLTAANARLAEYQEQAEARLAAFQHAEQKAAADRQAFETERTEAEARHQQAKQEHASEIAAAAARLVEYQLHTEALLAQSAADAAAALEAAEQEAATEREAAAERATQLHAQFEADLRREVAKRQAVEADLADTRAAFGRAEHRFLDEAAQMGQRAREYEAGLERAAQERCEWESTLIRVQERIEQSDRARAQDRATFERAQKALEADGARQRADYAELQVTLERTRAAADQALDLASRERAAERATLQGQLKALNEQLEARAQDLATVEQAQKTLEADGARQRADYAELQVTLERTRAAADQALDRASQERATLQEQLKALNEQLEARAQDLATVEQAQRTLEADGARQRADYAELQVTFERTRAAADQALDRASQERAAERATLQEQLKALNEKLEKRAQDLATVEQAQKTLEADGARQRADYAELQVTLERTRAAADQALDRASQERAAERAKLQEQLKALNEKLEAARNQRDLLNIEAERVPELRKQINEIQAEHRRQFDRMPASMCRCTSQGAMTQANGALASLLGYETPEELQHVDFSTGVFESGDELQWIVERCLASRSTESVETTWRTKDGSRIIVRVLATVNAPDSIDLAVQDITTLRVLEEKLRNSQRMEAVARYASEVAVTCDNLLRHVEQEGQEWLAQMDDGAARYHGERLLDEVARAEKFLRQLAVYGDEQKNVPEVVDVNTVLRDLEPVLKGVAGGNIDFVLPKVASPLNVDVDAERVERMLINIAAYGRERMPLGGRLMFELAPVSLDRQFVAKYPNVRPGPHVLITVSEVRGAMRPAAASAGDRPGVDLGALQTLVSECGGHLWMMVEPPGDMVLKIHLPRRLLDRPEPRPPARPSARARLMSLASGIRH